MTITQLEYLLIVDTYKSFANAAKHAFVTQPTLSMQIKKLEDELGVLIFDRSKKPVLTTDIGRQILDQARKTLSEFRRIDEIIQSQKDEIAGTLRIGIIPTLSPYLLPLFVTKFASAYPKVKLIVNEMMSGQIIHQLDNDLLDAGIMVSPIENNSILEIPLFYESFVAYLSKKHYLEPKDKVSYCDLNVDDMWLLQEGHCFRSQVMNLCSSNEGKEYSGSSLQFESGSLETLRKIVENQSGYTLLPELAILDFDEERKKQVRYFVDPQPIRAVSIAIHRSFMKKTLIEKLRETIIDNIPDSLKDRERGQLIKWQNAQKKSHKKVVPV